MLFAAALVPLVGVIGLSVDGGQWMLWKRELHGSADFAALAGARAMSEGQPVAEAVNRALAHNASRPFTIDSIESPPSTGSQAGNADAVRVELSTSESLPFSSMFLARPPRITVIATAVQSSTTPNCVIALDSSSTSAVTISGSASLAMNCGIMSNAAGSSAIDASAQSIDVAALSAAGTVAAGGGVSARTKINDGVPPAADPYSNKLVMPDLSSMCASKTSISVKSLQSQTISPGCYSSLKSLGGLYLNPGVYYIDGGDVTVGAQSLINGDGVTIVFTNSNPSASGSQIGKFKAAGNSYVQLSAMTPDQSVTYTGSSQYGGLLMYQDSRATPSNSTNFVVTGSSGANLTSYLQGTIYTPSTDTVFTGNSGLDTPCMQIVASQITFTGNTSVSNNCPAGSGASAFGGSSYVRLVE